MADFNQLAFHIEDTAEFQPNNAIEDVMKKIDVHAQEPDKNFDGIVSSFNNFVSNTHVLIQYTNRCFGIQELSDELEYSECSAGYVDCVNGYVRGNPSRSCSTECGGKCCEGDSACDAFTGEMLLLAQFI